jgi:hypothetical protein
LLLSLLDCSPIGNVLDIKYHVSSKDKLSWRRLQRSMICASYAICGGG